MSMIGRAAPHQLPITKFAHKAGNGESPLPAATDIAPKCQGAAAKDWLEARQAELLDVPYFHVVFTLPKPIADIAYQNKAVVYDILFKAAAETLITIAAEPKHLGARIGFTAVLHSWGSAMTQDQHS
jgi:hypothetical protein